MNSDDIKNLPDFFPNENIILFQPKIKAITIYKGFIYNLFLIPNKEIKFFKPKKKIIVTNKRIIITMLWETGPIESYNGAQSCFYNQSDYTMLNRNKEQQDSVILEYETGENKIFGKFIKLKIKRPYIIQNIKIYTDYNEEIKKIIKDNTNKQEEKLNQINLIDDIKSDWANIPRVRKNDLITAIIITTIISLVILFFTFLA